MAPMGHGCTEGLAGDSKIGHFPRFGDALRTPVELTSGEIVVETRRSRWLTKSMVDETRRLHSKPGQGSVSSIKRDVKKKVLPRPEGEKILSRDPAHCSFIPLEKFGLLSVLVHADIVFLTHKGAPFRIGWRCVQSQPIAKVGAFLYCVRWGSYATYAGLLPFRHVQFWEA